MPKHRTWTELELVIAVATSKSISEVARKLGLARAGGTHKHIKEWIQYLELDTSHFLGKNLPNRLGISIEIPDELVFVENRPTNSNNLRKRLIRKGYKQHKCDGCNLSEWLGKPIPLEVHHINGNNLDNRIENLSIVCPNCHAFTDSYRGKNKNRDAGVA